MPRRGKRMKDTLAPERPQILRDARDLLLLRPPGHDDPVGEIKHVVDDVAVDRSGAVAASGSPVQNAAAHAAARLVLRRLVRPVVEDVVYLGTSRGASHVEVVARLVRPGV